MEENKTLNNETKTTKKAKKPKKFLAFLKSRQAKRGAVAITLTVIFVAVIIGLNVLTTLLTARYSSLSVDLTSNDVYKLTESATQQLAKLDKDVDVYVLTTEENLENSGGYYVQVNKLIREFEKASEHINLKYIDLATDPSFTSKYKDINWYNSSYLMLIEHDSNYLTVAPEDVFIYEQDTYTGEYTITGQKIEQATLTAILNVVTEEKVGVTFLEVNSEVDASAFKAMLSNNAYKVDTISLLSKDIPQDTEFVVIYAPTNDIDKKAYETLTKWLDNDGNYGHTLVYVPNSMVTNETPNIDMLLEEWDMAVEDGCIFEQDYEYMTNSAYPNFISRYAYENTDFTEQLPSTSIPVVLSYCAPIKVLNSGASSLLSSSESAVIYPPDADQSWTPDDADPQKISGAAIATHSNEENTKTSNVIVIGSFDALSKGTLESPSVNNSAYFINLFNTISQRDGITLTIEGKTLDSKELGITSAATSSIIIILVRYIIPVAVVVVGIVMWIRRRHK